MLKKYLTKLSQLCQSMRALFYKWQQNIIKIFLPHLKNIMKSLRKIFQTSCSDRLSIKFTNTYSQILKCFSTLCYPSCQICSKYSGFTALLETNRNLNSKRLSKILFWRRSRKTSTIFYMGRKNSFCGCKMINFRRKNSSHN